MRMFSRMAVVLVLMLSLIVAIPILAEDSDAESMDITICDSSGNPYTDSIIDDRHVPFDTETIDGKVYYKIHKGTSVETVTDVYLKITAIDIPGSFNLSMGTNGLKGWMSSAGLACHLSLNGKELGTAAIYSDGTVAKFMVGEKRVEFEKDTLYRISFSAASDAVLSTKPEKITGLEIMFGAESLAESHLVHFDANGGTVSIDEKEVLTGKPLGSLPSPFRSGYAFDGWYSGDEEITSSTIMGHSDIYVKAEWIPKHILYLDPNGGKVDVTRIELKQGSMYGELPIPTRDGYCFKGWYTSAAGGSQVSSSTRMGSSDVTIYAHWSVVKEEDVTERTYQEGDLTVYERITHRTYVDGTEETEDHIEKTDDQDRIVEVSDTMTVKDPYGDVTVTKHTVDTSYGESGFIITDTDEQELPNGNTAKRTRTTEYDSDWTTLSYSEEYSSEGTDIYGHNFTESYTKTGDSESLISYDYGWAGTLASSDNSAKISVDYDGSISEAVLRTSCKTITTEIMEEITTRMDSATKPLESVSRTIILDNDHVTIDPQAVTMMSVDGYSLQMLGEAGSLSIDADCIMSSDGYRLKLSIVRGTEDNMTPEQLEAVGDGYAIVVTMLRNGEEVHEIGGLATIVLKPGLESDNLGLYHVLDDGTEEEMEMEYDPETGKVTFSTDHFSVYLVKKVQHDDIGMILLCTAVAASIIFIILAFILFVRKRRIKE